jgi:hypothetical protein
MLCMSYVIRCVTRQYVCECQKTLPFCQHFDIMITSSLCLLTALILLGGPYLSCDTHRSLALTFTTTATKWQNAKHVSPQTSLSSRCELELHPSRRSCDRCRTPINDSGLAWRSISNPSCWMDIARGGSNDNDRLGMENRHGDNDRFSLQSMASSSSDTSTSVNKAAASDVHVTDYISSDNLALLSPRGQQVLERLILYDVTTGTGAQQHVYMDWPDVGVEDDGKRALTEQLADLDATYPGGITAYLSKAMVLLQESADGMNPFADYVALVPTGESLQYEDVIASSTNVVDAAAPTRKSATSLSFGQAEELGMQVIGDCVFILVAGGLGERLGYSGIKLELSTNLCTSRSYLEEYVRFIQALEQRTNKPPGSIPLVIMTSGDTDAGTRKLLSVNNNFGMPQGQITIVAQDKVPALQDGKAGLALSDSSRWEIQTKPHGHGDVHHLLYKAGLTDQWDTAAKKYAIFLQDTNVLVVNSVVPTVGVSVHQNFVMNSICIPRLAGEAAGAITRLE